MKPLEQNTLDRLLSFLAAQREYVFLDNGRLDRENRKSFLFHGALERLDFFAGDDPAEYMAVIERAIRGGLYVAGWISYEFSYLLEPHLRSLLPVTRKNEPLASFGFYAEPIIHSHGEQCPDFPALETALSAFKVSGIRPEIGRDDYLQALGKIKRYIEEGDTYQVNFTLKLLFDFCGSPESLYKSLRENQSVSYGALMRFGDEYILSLSPELFFRVDNDRVQVRPMKGTMERGRYLEEDNIHAARLSNDVKNRSENVMIVDLLRNDLGRLVRSSGDNSVVTESLFDVERYESVLQMTSTISVGTEENIFSRAGLLGFFKALFPCGSVTGAPKIRTMEIIRELERSPRGVYTGGIGYFAPDGTAVFNVPIRTIRIRDGRGEMGIGSGIVHDSIPEEEWRECLLKAHFLTRNVASFYLIETMFLGEDGTYLLLDYHLRRLRESADYFSFHFSEETVVQKLDRLRMTNKGSNRRVRLTLKKDGVVSVESSKCSPPRQLSLSEIVVSDDVYLPPVRLSGEVVDTMSAFFYHKTSRRELFNNEFQRASSDGLFDMIFQNERGELTEGCISNIILLLDGEYITPPRSSGLLAGTMRRKILAESAPAVKERVLIPADLLKADAVFCCNSVRGIVQVRFLE